MKHHMYLFLPIFYFQTKVVSTMLAEQQTRSAAELNVDALHTSLTVIEFVVVLLLFNVHGKHLRSCRNGQLT